MHTACNHNLRLCVAPTHTLHPTRAPLAPGRQLRHMTLDYVLGESYIDVPYFLRENNVEL